MCDLWDNTVIHVHFGVTLVQDQVYDKTLVLLILTFKSFVLNVTVVQIWLNMFNIRAQQFLSLHKFCLRRVTNKNNRFWCKLLS